MVHIWKEQTTIKGSWVCQSISLGSDKINIEKVAVDTSRKYKSKRSDKWAETWTWRNDKNKSRIVKLDIGVGIAMQNTSRQMQYIWQSHYYKGTINQSDAWRCEISQTWVRKA